MYRMKIGGNPTHNENETDKNSGETKTAATRKRESKTMVSRKEY